MSKNPDPNLMKLPEHLRRRRGPVAAHDPSFWNFGPPKPGEGPKPIPRYRPPSAAADEPEAS